ncbi:MAG: prolyl oligopeptidase family serine peptidase [Planctomycetota bacterium]
MRYVVLTVLLVCSLYRVVPVDAEEPRPGKQVEQSFQSADDPKTKLDYLLYLPENYGKANERSPLLLFLHGAGERGSDLSLVKIHGPPKLIDQGQHFPFVVVSPQCPEKQGWSTKRLLALLDDLESRYSVDKDRVYVTGLSMGGFGTWSLIAAEPDRFAAAIPVCGHSHPNGAQPASRVPTWIVVGDRDVVALVGNSLGMVSSLQAMNADVKFTNYSGVGHDSWTQTYGTPEFYEWMLRHRVSDRRLGAP